LSVKILWQLSLLNSNLEEMMTACVPLIGMIQREEKEMLKLSCEILTRMVENLDTFQNIEKFFQDDDIICSLFVLFDSPEPMKQFFVLDLISKMIQKNEKYSGVLCEFGLLEYLITCTKSTNQETITLSIQILSKITKWSENIKKWAGEFDSINRFFEILKGKEIFLIENVLTILFHITKEERDLEELTNEKGDKVKKWKTHEALDENKKKIHEIGIQILLKYLEPTNDMKIIKLVVDILGNLAGVQEITKKLITKELTNHLIILLTSSNVNVEIRKSVHETMSSFARDEECVKKLVECQVMTKLLKMLKEKREALLAVELFASLNQHPSFQKEIFECNGLEEIKSLLKSENQQEREAGLKALLPFSNTPNGRMVLLQLNLLPILKQMQQPEETSLINQASAKALYKKLKKDENLFQSNGQTPFQFDYDEINRIDKDLIGKCQQNIAKRLGVKKMRMQINWRQIERLNTSEEKQDAIFLLGKEEIWEEFEQAIDLFTFDEETIHAFNTNVKFITIEVNHLKENESCIDLDEGLIMKYTLSINPEGTLFSPKQIAGLISMLLLDRDVTEEMEEIDEKYQLAVEDLKKVCKDSRIPMLGDINILYFHLLLSDKLYKESFKENQAIAVAKKEVLDPDEMFLKGWKVVKLNSKGLKQERLLILTNWNYYTICYDYKKKKVDYSHTKMHPLEEIDSVDIGLLKSKNEKDQTISVDDRIYSLNIWTIPLDDSEMNMKFDDSDFKDERKKNIGSPLVNQTESFLKSFRTNFGASKGEVDSPEPGEEPMEIKVGEVPSGEEDDDESTASLGDDIVSSIPEERDVDGLRNK
jgi:hypothetical protein